MMRFKKTYNAKAGTRTRRNHFDTTSTTGETVFITSGQTHLANILLRYVLRNHISQMILMIVAPLSESDHNRQDTLA